MAAEDYKVHPVYGATWAALFTMMVLGEFVAYPVWMWAALFIVFILTEATAVYRKQKGDTFSEMVWKFVAGGKDRRLVVWAVAIYLPLRITMLAIDGIPEWIPITVLGLGVLGWLIPHFSKQGKGG